MHIGGPRLKPDLIEEIVKWRMGAAYDTPILDWRDERLNFDTGPALDRDFAGAVKVDRTGALLGSPPGRSNCNPHSRRRVVASTEDFFNAWKGQEKPLHAIIAMQDARLFPSVEYIGPPIEAKCVQFSYARTVSPHWRANTEVILWPLDYLFRWWKLPTFSPTPWDHRSETVLWRGQPAGMSYALGEDARPVLTGIRQIRRWLKDFLTIEAVGDEETFRNWLSNYQRLLAVSMCRQIKNADVQFIPMYDGDRTPIDVVERYLGTGLSSDRIGEAEYLAKQQGHKYLLSLQGNDVPSSLRTDLLTGCVTLMPRPFWESVWFFGLQPYVHYIPLRADLADLEERLNWCRDNDAQCREIAETARAFALAHFEPSLEFKVQSRMVGRLVNLMSLGARA